jgi:chromosome segregation ATPase
VQVLEEQLRAAEEESAKARSAAAALEAERDEAQREHQRQVVAIDALSADKARLTALVSRLQGETVVATADLGAARQELATLRAKTDQAAQTQADLAGKLATQTALAEALEVCMYLHIHM